MESDIMDGTENSDLPPSLIDWLRFLSLFFGWILVYLLFFDAFFELTSEHLSPNFDSTQFLLATILLVVLIWRSSNIDPMDDATPIIISLGMISILLIIIFTLVSAFAIMIEPWNLTFSPLLLLLILYLIILGLIILMLRKHFEKSDKLAWFRVRLIFDREERLREISK